MAKSLQVWHVGENTLAAYELEPDDIEDEHANLIAQDGWEDDGERGRR